jgi:hypothetical protein
LNYITRHSSLEDEYQKHYYNSNNFQNIQIPETLQESNNHHVITPPLFKPSTNKKQRLNMPHLFTKIEIAAPPSIVREKFLQFEQIPTYSPNGFFKWLGPTEKNAPLEPGTRMHNVLEGMVIDPIILVSTLNHMS